jgi:hypothetical protein
MPASLIHRRAPGPVGAFANSGDAVVGVHLDQNPVVLDSFDEPAFDMRYAHFTPFLDRISGKTNREIKPHSEPFPLPLSNGSSIGPALRPLIETHQTFQRNSSFLVGISWFGWSMLGTFKDR